MSLVPDTKAGKIEFYKSRIALWTTNSVAIGSSPSEISALSALIDAAEAALIDQNTKHETAESATLAADTAIAAMDEAGATVISGVRHKARTAGDVVYTLANIPAPATPSPKPAPGMPTDFAVVLQNNGALTLTWKCPNPPGTTGTSYLIWRRIGTEQLAFLGATGLRELVDSTIPPGTVTATYQVQAFRSTKAGPWAQFNVNFTTEIGTGAASATVTEGPKMAA